MCVNALGPSTGAHARSCFPAPPRTALPRSVRSKNAAAHVCAGRRARPVQGRARPAASPDHRGHQGREQRYAAAARGQQRRSRIANRVRLSARLVKHLGHGNIIYPPRRHRVRTSCGKRWARLAGPTVPPVVATDVPRMRKAGPALCFARARIPDSDAFWSRG